jgi:hypothetical protein
VVDGQRTVLMGGLTTTPQPHIILVGRELNEAKAPIALLIVDLVAGR